MKKIYVLFLILTFLMLPRHCFAANTPKVYYDGSVLPDVQVKGNYTLIEHLQSNQEMISSTTYYFPYGESKRFAEQTSDIIRYYEVRDGAAWLAWQGKRN